MSIKKRDEIYSPRIELKNSIGRAEKIIAQQRKVGSAIFKLPKFSSAVYPKNRQRPAI